MKRPAESELKPPPPSNLPYLIAIVAMVLIGAIAVVLVFVLRPEADNATILAAIGGFIAPTLLSILTLMKAAEAKAESVETRRSVNGRMDAYEKVVRQDGYREGVAAGRAAGVAAANERHDVIAKDAAVKDAVAIAFDAVSVVKEAQATKAAEDPAAVAQGAVDVAEKHAPKRSPRK